MNLMTVISLTFLILEIVILGVGIFLGYRRGTGRSLVRLLYLAVIAVVSLLLGRAVAAALSETAFRAVYHLVPADIATFLDKAPDFDFLLLQLTEAILIPIFFSLIFAILQLLSLLFFGTLSRKLLAALHISKPLKYSKWIGAAIGLAGSLITTAILLLPMAEILYVTENISDDTAAIVAGAYEENGLDVSLSRPPVTLAAAPTVFSEHSFKANFDATKLSPFSNLILHSVTRYDVFDDGAVKEYATDSLVAFAEAGGSALYAFNVTAHSGGTHNDALFNAASALIPHLEKSMTLKEIVAALMRTSGGILEDQGEFMGFRFPQAKDRVVQAVIDQIIHTLSATTLESVSANMTTLFDAPSIFYVPDAKEPYVPENRGLLKAVSQLQSNIHISEMSQESAAALHHAVSLVADNSFMSNSLEEIHLHAIELIEENNIDVADVQYQPAYDEVASQISSYLSDAAESTGNVEALSEAVKPALDELIEKYQLPITEVEADIISICIAGEFTKDQYVSDGKVTITANDIMTFFGLAGTPNG